MGEFKATLHLNLVLHPSGASSTPQEAECPDYGPTQVASVDDRFLQYRRVGGVNQVQPQQVESQDSKPRKWNPKSKLPGA